GELGDLIAFLEVAAGVHGGFPRALGDLRDRLLVRVGDLPPDGEAHRPAAGVQLLQVLEGVGGGGGSVDSHRDRARGRAGDRVQDRGEHVDVGAGGVGSGVARAQHGQALAGVGAPGGQGVWNPKLDLKVGAAPSLLEVVVMIVASMSRTIHPFKHLPAALTWGEPAGAQVQQGPHVAADGAPCLGDRGQGRLIEGGQGAAQGGGGGGGAEDGPVVQAQTFGLGKVAASQHDRDGQVDQGGGSVPPGGGGAGGQVRGQGLGEAGAVGEFAEQEGSGVPDEVGAVGGHGQAVVPGR